MRIRKRPKIPISTSDLETPSTITHATHAGGSSVSSIGAPSPVAAGGVLHLDRDIPPKSSGRNTYGSSVGGGDLILPVPTQMEGTHLKLKGKERTEILGNLHSFNNNTNRHSGKLDIHGEANAKAALYRDRFQLLLQRISRDEHFSRPTFDAEMTESGRSEIIPIQSLIGCVGRRWIMGVISQLEDGHFFLEDLTAAVPIDISSAKITSGFFTENTVIVAEGEMLINGTFQVNTCGFPPLEDRETSLSLLMGLDFFGSGLFSAEETLRLSESEKKAVDDMFVILSEVWLDDDKKRPWKS